MKNNFSSFLILSLILTACGAENQDIPPVEYQRATTTSAYAAVTKTSPTDRQTNVAPNSLVVVQFSDRVHRDSVNNTTFRIEDETGRPVEGTTRLIADDTAIEFTPLVQGRRTVLNTATTYTVRARFIKDVYGTYTSPYIYKFRTEDFSKETGTFHVDSILPKAFLVFPDAAISVTFSEPIRRKYNQPMCQDSEVSPYSENFQFINADLANAKGNLQAGGIKGEICIVSSKKDDRYDRLIFRPRSGWPTESFIHLKVIDTPELRSESGARLSKSKEQWKMALFNLF